MPRIKYPDVCCDVQKVTRMCGTPFCLWFGSETSERYLFFVTSRLVAVIELNRGVKNSGSFLVLLVVLNKVVHWSVVR